MTSTSTRPKRTGLDLRWVDPDTRTQDDLFGYLNGRWLRTHEIPDDRAQDGAFRELRDRAEQDVRTDAGHQRGARNIRPVSPPAGQIFSARR